MRVMYFSVPISITRFTYFTKYTDTYVYATYGLLLIIFVCDSVT